MKAVSTPGIKEPIEESTEQVKKDIAGRKAKGELNKKWVVPTEDGLGPTETTKYRSIVALALYLAQDRADIDFVVKELARRMSNPDRWVMGQTQRLARHLIGKPRVLLWYQYQPEQTAIEVFSDSD